MTEHTLDITGKRQPKMTLRVYYEEVPGSQPSAMEIGSVVRLQGSERNDGEWRVCVLERTAFEIERRL